jgi:hypothetical protein
MCRSKIPFEETRRRISARKLQHFFKILFRCPSLAVPRGIRTCMRAGYVRGEDSLRFCDKVYDLHWAQGLIGEVYAFKTLYDVRASRGGVGPITLQESVAAFHYHRWGVVAASERATHDLFKRMQTHHTISRFKMFSTLLGHTLPSPTHTHTTHRHPTQPIWQRSCTPHTRSPPSSICCVKYTEKRTMRKDNQNERFTNPEEKPLF